MSNLGFKFVCKLGFDKKLKYKLFSFLYGKNIMTIKKIILMTGLISIICVILVFGGNFFYNLYYHNVQKCYFIKTMVFNGDPENWENIALINVTEEEIDNFPYLKKAIDDNISVEITRMERSNLFDFFYEKGDSPYSPNPFIYYDDTYYYFKIGML